MPDEIPGSTPAPSPTPTPAAPSTPAPSAPTPAASTPEPSKTFRFEEIDLDDDLPDEPPAPPVEIPPTEGAAPKVETPAAPVKEPVQPPAPPVEATPASPVEKPDPGKQLAEHRTKMLPELVKKYSFSEENKAAYAKDPTTYLAQAAAEMHYDIFMSVWQSFQAALPQIFEQHTQQSKAFQEKENTFFSMWPQLKGKDDQVRKSVVLYRQANPNATEDEIMKQSGLHAMLALGLNPAETAPNGGGGAPVIPPTRPAGAGASPSARPTAPAQSNAISEIVEHMLSGSFEV